MRWSELVMMSSVLGAPAVLSACGGDEARTGGSEVAGKAGQVLRAHATIKGPPGSGIEGTVRLTQRPGNAPEPGVDIEARISGSRDSLKAGPHGLHIHENASGGCVPPYTTAGGHFDPGPSGNPDPDANHPFHLGDVPNLIVDETGVGTLNATTSRITLSPGPVSVFDSNGSTIILHEKPDQGITGPPRSGVSGGPRIGCGVIELDR
jgi:Cu-Zn family superoxide dismutase